MTDSTYQTRLIEKVMRRTPAFRVLESQVVYDGRIAFSVIQNEIQDQIDDFT